MPEAAKLILAHQAKLAPWLEPARQRAATATPHPVWDFLFTYYSYPFAKLARWHPGPQRPALATDPAQLPPYLLAPPFALHHHTLALDPAHLPPKLPARARQIRQILAATAARPALLSCFGLHEWAMVYRIDPAARRHDALPLRLPQQQVDTLVSSSHLCCTHYDALRFFTPDALPHNAHQPSFQTRHLHEQPGCIHATMDLYKWAYKLAPWLPAERVANAFLLAAQAREIDMRASPYDLRHLGFEPIPIEDPEGRADYQRHQSRLAKLAGPLRQQLLQDIDALLALAGSPTPSPS